MLTLLNELGAPHALHALNMKAGENRQPAFSAVNPLGKVPAIRDGATVVTEMVAIFPYLADRFPQRGLVPAIGKQLRVPYLRWMVFYHSRIEPAIQDGAMKHAPAPRRRHGYGDFDAMTAVITAAISPGPHLLGPRFSAADILWSTALSWTTMCGLLPPTEAIRAYWERVEGPRPSFGSVRARDAMLAAEHEKAVSGSQGSVARGCKADTGNLENTISGDVSADDQGGPGGEGGLQSRFAGLAAVRQVLDLRFPPAAA